MSVSEFVDQHFNHFNARELRDAAIAWRSHLDKGGKMLLAMGGAMSTAEIGKSLARMIREGKIHAISCSANNLEEDLYVLYAGDDYKVLPDYRKLTAEAERSLRDGGFNRVTDTCIPESVMKGTRDRLFRLWKAARPGERKFPWEWFYEILDEDFFSTCQRSPENSWVAAAKEMGLPIYTPGWEDCTTGNMFTAACMAREIRHDVLRSGTEQMEHLALWYLNHMGKPDDNPGIGFFQIGGGIAGDFPICTVPMLIQDCQFAETRFWGYFAQISDTYTSYGSYSGAVPEEKITWWKLDVDAPKFMVQSDATICAPLIFAYVLGD